jgi:hypothetical protein
VTCGKFVVDLDRVAKLERRFLKLRIFQVSFALRNVLGFRFFRIRAAGEKNCDCEKKTE